MLCNIKKVFIYRNQLKYNNEIQNKNNVFVKVTSDVNYFVFFPNASGTIGGIN